MPNLLLALAALAAAPAPAAKSAALEPAAPAVIASAVGDCWRAVGASGVDRSRLSAAGWSVLADREDPGAPLDVLAKPGVVPLIMLVKAPEAKSLCSVLAKVASKADAGATLEAIQKNLQSDGTKAPASRAGEGIAFVSMPRVALVDRTDAAGGTDDQPALRIVVSYQIAEKK